MSTSRDLLLDFLYREARLLDDRQWDDWLQCYSPDVEFWMPAWDDQDSLTEDPHREISLIYYPNRDGLEDRVFRIKTERSSASTPEPRTAHLIANLEVPERRGRYRRAAFQLAHPQPSLQDHGLVFRHLVLSPRRQRRAAADHPQEDRAEERLHPPGHRYLPHLRAKP